MLDKDNGLLWLDLTDTRLCKMQMQTQTHLSLWTLLDSIYDIPEHYEKMHFPQIIAQY